MDAALARFIDVYVRAWKDTTQMRRVADWIEEHGDAGSQVLVPTLRNHADRRDAEDEDTDGGGQ